MGNDGLHVLLILGDIAQQVSVQDQKVKGQAHNMNSKNIFLKYGFRKVSNRSRSLKRAQSTNIPVIDTIR